MLKKVEDARRVSDFRKQKQEMFSSRKAEIDLRKSQQACHQLDSQRVGHCSEYLTWHESQHEVYTF